MLLKPIEKNSWKSTWIITLKPKTSKLEYCSHNTHFFEISHIYFLAVSFSISSIVLILSLCVFPLCFLLKRGLRCFSNIFAAISSDAISTPSLFAIASKNCILLPLVLFAQLSPSTTAPFLQLCNSTTCPYVGCVYLNMWWDKKHTTCFYYPCPVFPPPLVLLPCVVGTQLSAKINGGLVLLAFEADSLLYSVIALFHTCLLLALCVCPSVYLPWLLYTFGPCPCLRERLDLKEKAGACPLDYYVLVWL